MNPIATVLPKAAPNTVNSFIYDEKQGTLIIMKLEDL